MNRVKSVFDRARANAGVVLGLFCVVNLLSAPTQVASAAAEMRPFDVIPVDLALRQGRVSPQFVTVQKETWGKLTLLHSYLPSLHSTIRKPR
jgi:hypothetical protein